MRLLGPIHMKGCLTVICQGGKRGEKGGEGGVHPVNLYSSDGSPWGNGGLGTVTLG